MMMKMANIDRIQENLEKIRDMTAPCAGGTTRYSYSPHYRESADYLIQLMKDAGLETREDSVGNIFGIRHGKNPNAPKIISGSHLDTVGCGGYFDGQAGIICALEAARLMNENQITLESDYEVVATIMEEGSRFKNLGGSKFIMGVNTEKDLDQLDQYGISLRQAIKDYGLTPDLSSVCRKDENIKAFLEVHIEQNSRLEKAGLDMGIVDRIWGCRWYNVTVHGTSDHSSTPMDERHDPMHASSKFLSHMADFITYHMEGKASLTVGRIGLIPNEINVIPSEANFTLDFRSGHMEVFEKISEKLESEIQAIEKEYGVQIDLELYTETPPIQNSESVLQALEESLSESGLTYMHMDSRPGHDAMVFGMYWPTAMLFLPSHLGLTHCKDEWTDYEYVAKGAQILFETVKKIDCN